MTIDEALKLLKSAVVTIPTNFETHMKMQEALTVIEKALKPKPE